MLKSMGEVPERLFMSAAAGDVAFAVSSENGDNAKGKELVGFRSRKTRSPTPSPPPLFTFGKKDSRTTWHRQATSEQNYVQLVVEREGFPNGAIIADRLDPRLLFQVAPGLKKRLEGRRIFVPPASCLDEDTIESVVFGLLRCAKEGIPVPAPVENKSVRMIMMHCVLVFFDMEKEARSLEAKLWDSFQQVKLTPMDVLWIWDTFSGRVQSEPYTAPFSHQYVQMMAWQILNLDAVGLLDDDIRHLIELEKEPKYFTQTMEARFITHRLGKDPLAPETKTKVPLIPQATESEIPSGMAKGTVDTQKNKSEPKVAKQARQASTNHEPKPSNLKSIKPLLCIKAPAFKLAGLTDVFKSPPPRPTPLGTSDSSTTKTLSAPPKFNFSRASTNIVADSEAASQNTAQAGAKRSGMFTGNANGGKENQMTSNAQTFNAISAGFRFKTSGADASNLAISNTATIPSSSSSRSGVATTSQHLRDAFGQPLAGPPAQTRKQPPFFPNFGLEAPGITQPTNSASSQPTVGLGVSGGSTSNLFSGPNPSRTVTPTPSTQTPALNTFNLFATPNTRFQTAAPSQAPPNTGFSGFGGAAAASSGTSQGQLSTADNTFNMPTSNASSTTAFGTPAPNPPSNAGWFGAPLNSFIQPTPNTPAPDNSGFRVNTNFGGQSQQPDAFSQSQFGAQSQPQQPSAINFPNSLANPANSGGAGGNPFAFQGNAGGGAGGSPSGATGGGMVRRIAKATGPKRRR
ncbi:hypothetical protein PMIN06_000192 [Paraphaeosphaeria minitans]